MAGNVEYAPEKQDTCSETAAADGKCQTSAVDLNKFSSKDWK